MTRPSPTDANPGVCPSADASTPSESVGAFFARQYSLADVVNCRDRLRAFVDVREWYECWEWQAHRSAKGYGLYQIIGLNRRAHRLVWELANGTLLSPTDVACHLCDNPACCNPRHLVIADHGYNSRDSLYKGRNFQARKTHCAHGHPLSGHNLRMCGTRRVCRICHNAKTSRKHRPRRASA